MTTSRERLMRNHFLIVLAALLVLIAGPAGAWTTNEVPCDFVTGGGFIVHNGAHANFGVAGGGQKGALFGPLREKKPRPTPPAEGHRAGGTRELFNDANTPLLQGARPIHARRGGEL